MWQVPIASCTTLSKEHPFLSELFFACLSRPHCKLPEPEDSFLSFTAMSPAPRTVPDELWNQSIDWDYKIIYTL